MWEIPRVWDGGQCIIIGGGASFPRQFGVPESVIQDVFLGKDTPQAYSPYMESIHDQHVIAVNMAYRLGTWVDCIFFGDTGFLSKNGTKLFDFKGLRVTCAERVHPQNGNVKVVVRDRYKKFGVSFTPNQIAWNGNSGAAAINLAVHFGVSRIILLGFDMKLDDSGNQHWHKFYTTNLKTVGSTMKRHLQGFPQIAADLKGKVEVWNCSPDSAITSFPKINFKDLSL